MVLTEIIVSGRDYIWSDILTSELKIHSNFFNDPEIFSCPFTG